jgi:hypothetical protein
MSRTKLDKAIGKTIYTIVALWLVLTAAICAKAQEVKHFTIPKGPIDNKSIEDILKVVAVDCSYIDTYTASGQLQTSVSLIKIYQDETQKRVFLPNVYSTRRDAMGTCGAAIDQFSAQWRYVRQIARQQIASH